MLFLFILLQNISIKRKRKNRKTFHSFYKIVFDSNVILIHVLLSDILVLVVDIIRKFILSKKHGDCKS